MKKAVTLATVLFLLSMLRADSGFMNDVESLRLYVKDTMDTYGMEFPEGMSYLKDIIALEKKAAVTGADKNEQLKKEFQVLRRRAMLDNPAIDFENIIVLKRKKGQMGLPTNHQCNTMLNRTGYDNEFAIVPIQTPKKISTLYRPANTEYVGEMDLHFDGKKMLFTQPVGKAWQIFEIGTDGKGLRQVSKKVYDNVDNFDPCYLPDGRIIFASTASFTGVPCWHGQQRACCLYQMDSDGNNIRQLCYDQDLDLHPSVLPTGQVIYSRWDYTGIMHMYMRPLMVMNPDGTGQRAVYGSNSYWPPCLFFPRGIDGHPGKVIAILSGYHGSNREGMLALIDLTKGYHKADGIIQMIPGRDKKIVPIIKDVLTQQIWPKFLHPYPVNEKTFLVSMKPGRNASWGIYMVDIFDNILPIAVDKDYEYYEPIILRKKETPPEIPDRIDLTKNDATVFIQDIYSGPGLKDVPRGTIKKIRMIAYNYGYPGLAGPDKIGCGGPWEAMRIIGTVPVYEDGSASFKVPANTPLAFQLLDSEVKAVQLMRSWYTAMPGEAISCVGCHENPNESSVIAKTVASRKLPDMIKPWYGPARGFDFEREVQPVLDKYCVGCHNGSDKSIADLRSEEHFPNYAGRQLNRLGSQRLDPELVKRFGSTRMKYTPAYEVLISYIRRVGIEDDVNILTPGEYHADTSELIQMLDKGHYNVRLDNEAWDRLVTWIDINGPCHGTWNDIAPIPGKPDEQRKKLAKMYGGLPDDPEWVPMVNNISGKPIMPKAVKVNSTKIVNVSQWPVQESIAKQRQQAMGQYEREIELADDITLKLVRIPAGRFVMGSINGSDDERDLSIVNIESTFWMGAFEITNKQFRLFEPGHNSGYFMKRYPGKDGPGLDLNVPDQPAVRVSWKDAMEFCSWLSAKTGMEFTLPTEGQWEYACRAGSDSEMFYGSIDSDFSKYANLADQSMGLHPAATGGVDSSLTGFKSNGIFAESIDGGDIICNVKYNDNHIETSAIGSYQANAWGLYDMHGNAAEWTLSDYSAYPYDDDDGRNSGQMAGRKVVRGGSFCDRPKRATSAYRLDYPYWQRVHNAGFRVVCKDEKPRHIAGR